MNQPSNQHPPSRRPHPPRPECPRAETKRYHSSTLGMAMTFGLSVVASPQGLQVRTAPPSHPRRQAGH
jgi:hypothetical protein